MSRSIGLKQEQIDNLIMESFKLRTSVLINGIDLFINSKNFNLIWLQKMRCKKEDLAKIPKFNDEKIVYLGRIYNQVNENELRAFIYNKIFKLEIRKKENYYGSQEIKTLNLNFREYRNIY